MWKFLRQGSNLYQSSNPSCCSDNAGTLIHWATKEAPYTSILLKLCPVPKSPQPLPTTVSGTHGSWVWSILTPLFHKENQDQEYVSSPLALTAANWAHSLFLQAESQLCGHPSTEPPCFSLCQCFSMDSTLPMDRGGHTLQERLVDGREGLAQSSVFCLGHERQAEASFHCSLSTQSLEMKTAMVTLNTLLPSLP